jgi:glutathione S-transferase
MALIFFYAPMSSATPVAWALSELAVPHEGVKLDLKQNEQRQPAFLKLNPNGKVPTLVVDGTPMFEAVAIMQWLGERYGVSKQLWPAAEDPARLQALSWTTWAYVSLGNTLRGLFTATSAQVDPSFHNAPQAEHYRKEAASLLAILDERLAQQPFLLSAQFSLADLIVASVVGWAAMNNVSLSEHARVRSWLARCQERPSYTASWRM